jgi:hypothetical protein
MKFSEGRRSHLAHVIIDTLVKEDLWEVEEGRERFILNELKETLDRDHEADAHIDVLVRKKIASLSRNVPLGSPEWDILYRKYYEEESRKVGSTGVDIRR